MGTTVQRIGYGLGAAATGIGADASTGERCLRAAARAACFWIFGAFVLVLIVGVTPRAVHSGRLGKCEIEEERS